MLYMVCVVSGAPCWIVPSSNLTMHIHTNLERSNAVNDLRLKLFNFKGVDY